MPLTVTLLLVVAVMVILGMPYSLRSSWPSLSLSIHSVSPNAPLG